MADPAFCVVIWDDAWGDATASATIQDAFEKHRPTVMQTVGWVLVDDEKGISTFAERCLDKGEESYRGRTFIPRSLVKSCTPMSLTRKRARKDKPPPENLP